MLPDCILDVETRSRLSLKKAGAYRYAADESTQCTIASYRFVGGPIYRWRPLEDQPPDDLVWHIADGGKLVSHGPFERVIWNLLLRRQFPFLPVLQIEQCSDLMVRAFYCNLPGKLEQLASIMGGPQKDMAGHALMMKLSKPKRDGSWSEDPDDMLRQELYCDQDVEVETYHHSMLPELPAPEQELWRIDQRMNDRGVPRDMQFVRRAIKLVDYAKNRANEDISNLTSGAVNKATEVGKLVTWLNSRSIHTTSLQKGDRQRLLDIAASQDDWEATEALELRATTGKTSTSKYRAIEGCAGTDGVTRGGLQYGGAQQTLRWAGRLTQDQNMPRVSDEKEAAIVAWVVKLVKDESLTLRDVYDMIELIGPPRLANGDNQNGMSTLAWLAKSLRSTIAATPGHIFVGGDFSNIEGRVNAWLAGETWKLQAFRDYDAGAGPDMYKLAYAKAFNIPVEKVDKLLRQIGKVIELQCGYQGGVGAFITAANTYLLKLPALAKAIMSTTPAEVWDGVAAKYEHAKDKFDLDQTTWTAIKIAVIGWRKAHPHIVECWWELQDAAVAAVDRPGLVVPVYNGRCRYVSDGSTLYCYLPSGRPIRYNQPYVGVVEEEVIWDGVQYVDTETLFPAEIDKLIALGYKVVSRKRRGVRFMGLSDTKQWVRKFLYGGYQCENIVQAVSRDFMALAMVRSEGMGYLLRLTVHDELLAMIKVQWYARPADFERFYQWLLTQLPEWAPDFPMAASVWAGDRYTK